MTIKAVAHAIWFAQQALRGFENQQKETQKLYYYELQYSSGRWSWYACSYRNEPWRNCEAVSFQVLDRKYLKGKDEYGERNYEYLKFDTREEAEAYMLTHDGAYVANVYV